MILIEEGRMSWDPDSPFRTTISPPCLGGVGRFGFAPHIHGAAKIFFFL